MKRIMFLMAVVFLFADYSQAAELVGHWRFDEGEGVVVKDSAWEHSGEVNGAAWVKGKMGSALEFDGKSYVEIKDTTNSCFDLTSMTLSACIYPKAYPERSPVSWGGIVGKCYYGESTYGLRLGQDKKLHLRVYGPFGKEGKEASFGYPNKTVINLNQWYHVVVTYDNAKVKFYINGKLDATYEETRLPKINNQSIFIGTVRKEGRYFTGIIDEVKIYKGALTEEEIEMELSLFNWSF